ncbi:MAG: dephospho-CoA kinase [Actinomycetota bacterium]
MRLVALTGGIGSGKSSVSERLAARGAVIVDADLVVRQLQQPGAPVFDAMVERWGDGIIGADGSLDRAGVAAIVFADSTELDALNDMVHPAVRREMRAQTEQVADTDSVVVLDIPLLAEGGADRRGASAVIVVDCAPEVAIDRLVAHRGFDRADAEARIAAQATRAERLAMADFVVDNGGDLAQLDAEVERCWAWLESLDATPWPPPEAVTEGR